MAYIIDMDRLEIVWVEAHPTWELAHAALVKRMQERLGEVENLQAMAFGNLKQVMGMKKPGLSTEGEGK